LKLKQYYQLLPKEHQWILIYLSWVLNEIMKYEDINKMSLQNILIVFGPTVMKDPDPSSMDFSQVSNHAKIFSLFLTHFDDIFGNDAVQNVLQSFEEHANEFIIPEIVNVLPPNDLPPPIDFPENGIYLNGEITPRDDGTSPRDSDSITPRDDESDTGEQNEKKRIKLGKKKKSKGDLGKKRKTGLNQLGSQLGKISKTVRQSFMPNSDNDQDKAYKKIASGMIDSKNLEKIQLFKDSVENDMEFSAYLATLETKKLVQILSTITTHISVDE